MNVKIKFSKVYVLLMIIAIFVLLYFLQSIYTDAKNRTIIQYQKQQKVLVYQSALAVNSYLDERIRALEILADFPASKKGEEKIFLTEYKRTYEKISGFIFISFVDTLGNLLTGFPSNKIIKSNIFTDTTQYGNLLNVWLDARANKTSLISKVFNCCDTVRVLFLLSPIFDKNVFKGMIVSKLFVNDFIIKQVNPILSEYDGYVWILESDGKLVYHSLHNNLSNLDIINPDKSCFTCHKNFYNENKLLQQESGNLIGTGRKSDQLTSFTSIKFANADWRIAISFPKNKIEAVLKNLGTDFLLLSSLVFILLISSVALLFFQIRKVEKAEIAMLHQNEKMKLERRYIDLVEKLPDGIFIYKNDEFIFFNNSLSQILTSTPKVSFAFSSSNDESHFFECIDKVKKKESRNEQLEIEVLSADNKKMNLFIIVFQLETDDEDAVHGIVRDITELKRLEEEKKKKENLVLLGEMGARIAHEIKNPLASILTGIQLLKSKYKYSNSEDEFFERIISEIRRMDNTVKSILHFAKNYDLHLTFCKIEDPLNEVIKVSSSMMIEKNISIDLQIEPSLPDVKIDQELWKQIFWNLLNNSIQAINNYGKILIRIFFSDDKIIIEFGDTGLPIQPENYDKVFQPFFSTKSQGTGLGLAITKRFIELHNAKIMVNKKNTTLIKFIIELPIQELK
ncbi:MAG: sensor histidine kinase [Stygiobacter sp.]